MTIRYHDEVPPSCDVLLAMAEQMQRELAWLDQAERECGWAADYLSAARGAVKAAATHIVRELRRR